MAVKDALKQLEAKHEAMSNRTHAQVMAWLYEDDCSTLDHCPSFDEKYPIAAKSKRDQEKANQAFRAAVENYRRRSGKKYKDMARELDTSEKSWKRYRKEPKKTPRDVAEKFCEMADITMDELRGCGNPWNEILPSGTTTDYLLGAEVWTSEQVKELYSSADEDTKRAVTFALKSWLKAFVLESELDTMSAREQMVRTEIRKIVPRE